MHSFIFHLGRITSNRLINPHESKYFAHKMFRFPACFPTPTNANYMNVTGYESDTHYIQNIHNIHGGPTYSIDYYSIGAWWKIGQTLSILYMPSTHWAMQQLPESFPVRICLKVSHIFINNIFDELS